MKSNSSSPRVVLAYQSARDRRAEARIPKVLGGSISVAIMCFAFLMDTNCTWRESLIAAALSFSGTGIWLSMAAWRNPRVLNRFAEGK